MSALIALGVLLALIAAYKLLIGRAGTGGGTVRIPLYRAVKWAILVALVVAVILASRAR
jgi:hypothetical protein